MIPSGIVERGRMVVLSTGSIRRRFIAQAVQADVVHRHTHRTEKSLRADRRFAGEIETIVFAEVRKVMVRQPGAGDIENVALWDGRYVPNACGLVHRPGQNASAIGAKGDGHNRALMPLKGANCLSRRSVPQPGSPVI